jgi:hypothetical protein
LAAVRRSSTVVAQNDQDLEAEWALVQLHRRRYRINANVNYDLPFGPNRPLLNNGGRSRRGSKAGASRPPILARRGHAADRRASRARRATSRRA